MTGTLIIPPYVLALIVAWGQSKILTAQCALRAKAIGDGAIWIHSSIWQGRAMWRDVIRRILIFFRFVERTDLAVQIMESYPAAKEINEGEIIIVQNGGYRKWACLRCPGKCGKRIQLNLSKYRKPCWTVHLDWLLRPSVVPSVCQLNACQCHFWIRKGKVRWVNEVLQQDF